jgi:hypothetical protein
MKLLQNLPAIAKTIVVAGMLGACQNEQEAIVHPITERSEQADQNAKLNPTFKVNRLLSDDNVTLSYTGPLRLLYLQTNNGTNEYTSYNYANSNQIVGIKRNVTTQAIIETSVYVINASGKCDESHHVKNGVTEIYLRWTFGKTL